MSGAYSRELAFAAGETYDALDRERRDWWDDLSRTVEAIVADQIEAVFDGSIELLSADMRAA